MSPDNHDIGSLTKPFDMTTWYFLVGFISCLCLYFRKVFQLTKKQSMLEIHNIVFCLNRVKALKLNAAVSENKLTDLLISWLLLVFLVGNAYKGVLFSLLTTLSVPVVPETLQEVVQSDYLVLTTSALLISKGDKTFKVSAAQMRIDSILEEVNAGKLNISNSNMYQKLNKILAFLYPADASDMFVAMEADFELKSETKNYTIPKKIVILDTENIVKVFEELNTIFTKNLLVLGETLNLFSTRNQWIFSRKCIFTVDIAYYCWFGRIRHF